jgi:Flp pilus assembly protein TadD
MQDRFLSSEDYDERAHKLYNDGDYDGALEMLKEGLSLYPNAVELYVGLGYARLAREEYAWGRQAFERALVLDPGHEDAMVGMGEALLRFGAREQALTLFRQVEAAGYDDDEELLLTMGRALYREAMWSEARDLFAKAVTARPDSAEAVASLAYALHRLGDELGAGRHIRRALRLDPDLHEARIYLGHLLYDRGDWEGALREFERVPPGEHWDALAVWRIMELKRALWQLDMDDSRLIPWADRLRELEILDDPVDRLLAEIESEVNGGRGHRPPDPSQLELFGVGSGDGARHQVRLADGQAFRGNWVQIVRQMRDQAGFGHETLTQFMRRMAERWHEQSGREIPFQDPETFLRAAIAAGLLIFDDDRSSR